MNTEISMTNINELNMPGIFYLLRCNLRKAIEDDSVPLFIHE